MNNEDWRNVEIKSIIQVAIKVREKTNTKYGYSVITKICDMGHLQVWEAYCLSIREKINEK